MIAKLWAHRKAFLLILIVTAVVGIILVAAQFALSYYDARANAVKTEFKGGTAYLKLANTPEARVQGLSGVKKMPRDSGLLMDFQADSKWGIWMKDMYIPLDILWLDKDKKVIYIIREAHPELGTTKTFEPKDPARYVIELNSGAASRYMVTVGDVIQFE
jgi:uncharacterized membrane protein (UPF0127 family)